MAIQFVPTPALYQDGTELELYALDPNGQIQYMHEAAPDSGVVPTWTTLPKPGGLNVIKSPVASTANLIDTFGTGLYVIAADGLLYSCYKIGAPDDSFTDWAPYGGPFCEPPAVTLNAGLVQQMFITGTDDNLYHYGSNSAWLQWPGALVAGTPATGKSFDGRIEVMIVGLDGSLYHQWEVVQAASDQWSGWYSHGNPGVELTGSPSMASAYQLLHVFVTGMDGSLYHKQQTAPSNGWTDWQSFGNPGQPLLSSPVVGASLDGRLELFAIGQDENLYHRWQLIAGDPFSPWSDWYSHGNPGVPLMPSPAVMPYADGRLGLKAVGFDGNLYYKYQTYPNNGWSGWMQQSA